MSFSSDVKDELTRMVVRDETLRIDELIGFLITNAYITREDKDFILKMCTENELAIRRIYTTLKTHYGIIAKSNVERPKIVGTVPLYHLKVYNKNDLKLLFNEDFLNINEKLQIVLNNKDMILKDAESQRAFLRGVFLGSGSIINPDSRYHLELAINNQENAIFVNEILESFEINSKMIKRKKDFVIYLKVAEAISTFLAAIGANQGTLKFEETRVIKDVRNNINRVSNFENANFDKTVDASLVQLEDINLIKRNRKFAKLPEPLKELARLRMSFKEATFDELRKNA